MAAWFWPAVLNDTSLGRCAFDPSACSICLTEGEQDGLINQHVPKSPRNLLASGRPKVLTVWVRYGFRARNWEKHGVDAAAASVPFHCFVIALEQAKVAILRV